MLEEIRSKINTVKAMQSAVNTSKKETATEICQIINELIGSLDEMGVAVSAYFDSEEYIISAYEIETNTKDNIMLVPRVEEYEP